MVENTLKQSRHKCSVCEKYETFFLFITHTQSCFCTSLQKTLFHYYDVEINFLGSKIHIYLVTSQKNFLD